MVVVWASLSSARRAASFTLVLLGYLRMALVFFGVVFFPGFRRVNVIAVIFVEISVCVIYFIISSIVMVTARVILAII